MKTYAQSFYFASLVLVFAVLIFSVSCNKKPVKPVPTDQWTYYKAGENNLASNEITCMTKDELGNIWIGTRYGFSKYDGTSFTSWFERDGLIYHEITAIAVDKLGNVWLGTPYGLSKFDGHNFTNYNTDNGLGYNEVYGIGVDKLNGIWVGTGHGVSVFDGSVWKYFEKQGGESLVHNN
jgi:ligand-binding sensor domain-containing protein